MGCYGYCVLPGGTSPPEGVSGIEARPVTARTVGSLSVWFSDMSRPEPSLEHVQAHNRVVEAAVTEAVTPVPLRFGQWAAQAPEFDGLVAERAAWYEERLRAFAGAMEFGIRVLRPDKQTAQIVRHPAAESGTAYMEALRARVAAAQSEREEGELVRAGVAEVVRGLVREERVDELRTSHGIITIAHLVARVDFDRYREQVHRLRERLTAFRFLVSGPWVPYSFAT